MQETSIKTIARLYPRQSRKIGVANSITFQPYAYDGQNIDHLLHNLPRLLTPKFLSPEWKRRPRRHRFSGLSLVATEAFYFLINSDSLQPQTAVDSYGHEHFWLVDGEQLFDPTGAQYQNFDYTAGRDLHWVTPSTNIQLRSLLLIQKLLRFDGIAHSDHKLSYDGKRPMIFW